MEQYKAKLRVYQKDMDIERVFLFSFSHTLYELALNLFASLVAEEEQEKYSFFFSFDQERYITRKDEQELLYGYSDRDYHILEQEAFLNIVLRNPKQLSFEIVDLSRRDNIVFDLDVEEIQPQLEKMKPILFAGHGFLGKNLNREDKEWKEIVDNQRKSLPLLKKAYRFSK